MGSGSSKQNAVIPKPISTTVAVPTTTVPTTTVPTTTVPTTTVPTTVANIKASEGTCWIDNPEILYMSLAFLSGVLLTMVVFAIICLIRQRCQRSHQSTQEQAPSQTATEELAKNSQNEVAYTTLVFRRAPMAV